jgi:hypothetical protein
MMVDGRRTAPADQGQSATVELGKRFVGRMAELIEADTGQK